jgi:hypothetical protein
MAHPAGRTAVRAHERLTTTAAFATRPSGQRHPLVAVAMVLPLAVLLAVIFGGVEAVVIQASSVAGALGR